MTKTDFHRHRPLQPEGWVDQIAQALRNIVGVLACDDGGAEHMTSLVRHLADKRDYLGRRPEVGRVYHRAKAGIQTTAVVAD